MTPQPGRHAVVARLGHLRSTLNDLEALRTASVDRLTNHPLERAAAERLLQVLVELAVDINAHLVVEATGVAPANARASFVDAGSAGCIPTDLAGNRWPRRSTCLQSM